MTPNLCGVERLVRIAIRLGLVYIAAAVTPAAPDLLGFIGIITCVTAAVGWCPIYEQLGVSSQATVWHIRLLLPYKSKGLDRRLSKASRTPGTTYGQR